MPAVTHASPFVTGFQIARCLRPCNDGLPGTEHQLRHVAYAIRRPVESSPEEIALGWPAAFSGARFETEAGYSYSAVAIYADSAGQERWTAYSVPFLPNPVPEAPLLWMLAAGVILLRVLARRSA